MFILDLYRFAESRKNFTRREFAEFVFSHRETERLSRHAGLNPKQFASCVSREFIPRLCTLGYMDMQGQTAWVRDRSKRPFNFDLESYNARQSNYIRRMVNVGKMDDDQLFGEIDAIISERKADRQNH